MASLVSALTLAVNKTAENAASNVLFLNMGDVSIKLWGHIRSLRKCIFYVFLYVVSYLICRDNIRELKYLYNSDLFFE